MDVSGIYPDKTKGPRAIYRTGSNKKGNPLWKFLKALITLAILGGIGYYAYTYFSQVKAQDVSIQIIEKLKAGECTHIYNLQTSTQFREKTNELTWAEICNRVGSAIVGEPRQIELDTNEGSNDPSLVDIGYIFRDRDNYDYEIDITMVKEDDEWRMLTFDSKAL